MYCWFCFLIALHVHVLFCQSFSYLLESHISFNDVHLLMNLKIIITAANLFFYILISFSSDYRNKFELTDTFTKFIINYTRKQIIIFWTININKIMNYFIVWLKNTKNLLNSLLTWTYCHFIVRKKINKYALYAFINIKDIHAY